jgi:hypothetical protein
LYIVNGEPSFADAGLPEDDRAARGERERQHDDRHDRQREHEERGRQRRVEPALHRDAAGRRLVVQHLDERDVVQTEVLATPDQDLVRRRHDVDLCAVAVGSG